MSMVLLLKDFSVRERKEKLKFQEPEILSSLLMGECHFVMSLATCSNFDGVRKHWLILGKQSVLARKHPEVIDWAIYWLLSNSSQKETVSCEFL